MPHGGARNRSGPSKDPDSFTSARRGFSLTALPAEGYRGVPPYFPLVLDARLAKREAELWKWAWQTPQACAWAREPWRWHAVAMWVRTAAVCETAAATAADKSSLHRFADQIGLTPAGLKENGWKIAADELAQKRSDTSAAPARTSTRDRMKVVAGGDGA